MKKVSLPFGAVLLLLGAGLFPYAVLASVLLMNLYQNEAFLLIVPIALVLGLVCAISFSALSSREKWPAHKVALGSMLLKLAQIPTYVLFFVIGLMCVAFIKFLAITLIVWLIDVATIRISGIVGRTAVSRCQDEGVLTDYDADFYGRRQFKFCVDVTSAITVYKKSKEVSV